MAITFALEVAKFAEKTKGDLNTITKNAIVDLSTRIMEKSPVGDAALWKEKPPKGYVGGHFRANWNLGVGTVPDDVFDNIDPSGQVSINRIVQAIPEQAAGNIYYLVNNLPYAERLETGWSTQAPTGMVALTVIEWYDIVNQAVGNAQNGYGGLSTSGFEAYPI